MSIMIKDMEMPEACDDCPFHVYHSHYKYVCKATPMFYPMNLANSKGIRKDWCPLLEVTERKTGRWIEHEWAEKVGGTNGMLISNYECSECHCWKRETSDFCPHCGADMIGGSNGKNT